MKSLEKAVAEKLLRIKAVKLQPRNPFTWASGWKSPIYCDNRKTLSYPSIRNYIKVELVRTIINLYPDVEVIAGVATGAIAQGALVADELGLPFIYVRSSPKDHGLENLIEGDLKPKQKVVIIEDLISTGGSSLKAVEAIRRLAQQKEAQTEETEYISKEEVLEGIDAGLKDMIAGRTRPANELLEELRHEL